MTKAVLFCCAVAVAMGQSADTSGNGMLKGNYQFRNVAVQNVDSNDNPTEVTATYGLITFDGNGNYTITGMQVDNTVSSGAPQAFSTTGVYAISASGMGYVSSPLYSGSSVDTNDYEYGAVSQGIFVGSTTEAEDEGYILNDIFIAIPVGTAPTNASFTSAYQTGLLDLQNGGSASIMNALFTLTPNGSGGFGTISLSGQASNQSATSLTQAIGGATYSFAGTGAATLTIPLPTGVSSTNALFTGTKTMYESADGNFILGWTPTGYDIFFGVKALGAGTGSNSLTKGLYFTAGLEDSPASGGSGTDSFFGGSSNTGDSNGDGIVHQRFNYPGYLSYDYGSDNIISVNSSGSAGPDYSGYDYLFGDGGSAFVAIGTGGLFSLTVGLHAGNFSGSGVYLNPIGMVNAASYQPVTARIAPGELIVLYGTGLASTTQATQGGSAFPTTLEGVSVMIDGNACPIYYVSPTALAVIVPYEISTNSAFYATIQATNNGVASNTIYVYYNQQDSAPGAFSQNANGIGYASALHAATGQLITQSNPAQPSEYISLYLTGLGTVTPPITDGALGPTSTLSTADVNTAGNLTVNFNDFNTGSFGNQGTIQFAGLAPGLAGLYQINVQVPSSGLGSGDNVYIELITDMADIDQIQIPYGSASAVKTQPKQIHPLARKAHGRKIESHRRTCADRAGVCIP
jgi:uncharacterized protein (TIGR03437 family)